MKMQGDVLECDLSKENFISSINIDEKQILSHQHNEVGKIVKNVRNILKDLERSINKSSKYETEVLSSMSGSSGYHSHVSTENWKNGGSKVYFIRALVCLNFPSTTIEKSLSENGGNEARINNTSRSEVNLSDSWSTMSIVCLQYQYDELTRKYQNLLRVHDERCKDVSSRDAHLAECKLRLDSIMQELEAAHAAVHSVCCKYLALKKRKDRDKSHFELKISALQETTEHLLSVIEESRDELDEVLCDKLIVEHDPTRALLMDEIRRSNELIIENMRLKARIAELAPETLRWQERPK